MFYCNTLVRNNTNNNGNTTNTTIINQGSSSGIPYIVSSEEVIFGTEIDNTVNEGEVYFDENGKTTLTCDNIAKVVFHYIDNDDINVSRLFIAGNLIYISFTFDNYPDKNLLLSVTRTVINVNTITLIIQRISNESNFSQIDPGTIVRGTLYFKNQGGGGDGTIEVGPDDIQQQLTTDTIIFDSSGFILTRPEANDTTVNIKNYFQNFS